MIHFLAVATEPNLNTRPVHHQPNCSDKDRKGNGIEVEFLTVIYFVLGELVCEACWEPASVSPGSSFSGGLPHSSSSSVWWIAIVNS